MLYIYEIAAVNITKIYFLKNAKKTCKPNNRDLNCDWKKTKQKKNGDDTNEIFKSYLNL